MAPATTSVLVNLKCKTNQSRNSQTWVNIIVSYRCFIWGGNRYEGELRHAFRSFSQLTSRFTFIVFANGSFSGNLYARKAILKYLKDNVTTGEPIALIKLGSRGGMQVIHDFSTDPAVLAATLEKVTVNMGQQLTGTQTET